MNENDLTIISALQKRLDRVEAKVGRLKTSNRLLTWALLGLLAIGAFLFILSAASPPSVQDVVKAKAFKLVDGNGKLKASMESSDNGGAWLSFYDEKGRISPQIGSCIDGASSLVFYDADGKIRAELGRSFDGTPWLMLCDANGDQVFAAP